MNDKTEIDRMFSPGTYDRMQTVLNKYGANATVWLVTLHEDDWEQTIYVIDPNRKHAVSCARALCTFEGPKLRTVHKHTLHQLEPAEIAEFIGPQGQPQNIAIFDAVPEE